MTQSTQAISPLRQRMIDDMRLRKLSPKTQTSYIRAVRRFAGFLGRTPETASAEDLRRYQLHLVERGKGKRDRYAMLSPALLALLRTWWRHAHAHRQLLPGGWLFTGQNPVNPLSTRQLNRAFHFARKAAEIDKPVSLHSLRHAFATHLLELHEDIRVIQVLLGHKKLQNTARYSQVEAKLLREVKGPLEYLKIKPPK